MLPKERVLAAIGHQEPDRVPIDYDATDETNQMIMDYLGLSSSEDVLKAFDVDFRYVAPLPKIKTFGSFFGDPLIKEYKDGRLEDIWGIKFRKIDYGLGIYYECDESPLALVRDQNELNDFVPPDVHKIWDFSTIKAQAEKDKDYAIVFNGAVLLQFCQPLRGMQQLMMDLHENPNIAQAILSRVVDYWIAYGTALLKEADGLVDIFTINDDYGMQQGPLFNPQIWREYIKPLIWKAIKAYKEFGVKIAFHSCGSVYQFIPDFIEMGVDILDPVQVSAKSMVPKELKASFGDSICFRGAIDTQRILPYGTVEDVRCAVRAAIHDLASRGGYFFTSVHNLQPDVKPENIKAMYDAVKDYGNYPLDILSL